MNRGVIHRPADLMVLVTCLCATAFVLGMGVAKNEEKPEPQCAPGFVSSARFPDGRLTCDYERADWRRPIERRRVK